MVTTDQASPTSDDTNDFYEITNQLVIEVWGEDFHQGYWTSEDDQSSNQEATQRLTDVLIDKSDLGNGGRVLDVGCGIGVPALRIAERTPAEVVGISNNESQLAQAKQRAERSGLADRVSFAYADAVELPYDGESFDVVWIFETLMHLDRPRALREALRVLRPGGRIVVTDQLRTGPMSADNERMVSEFLAAMQASPLLDLDSYRALVAGAGFEPLEVLDISRHTSRTGRRMTDSVNQRWDELVGRFGEQVTPVLEAFRHPVALVPELGYVLAVARKPA